MRFRPFQIPLSYLSAITLTASLVGLAAWMLTPPQATLGQIAPIQVAPSDPYSPLAVAETIDSIVQPRFFKFDDSLFGMSRIARPEDSMRRRGHKIENFAPESESEAEPFQFIEAAGRDYMILFYRSAAPPPNSRPYLRSKKAEFRLVVGSHAIYLMGRAYETVFDENKADWYPMVQEELSRLKRGLPVDREAGDWLLAMRPVKNNTQCVSCHVGSKPEDMLGIMVYAVRKTRTESETPPPPQRIARQMKRVSTGD